MLDIEEFGNPFFKSDGLALSGGVALRIQRVTERVEVVVTERLRQIRPNSCEF
ncbi:hypothetical protein ACVC7V_23615 [Hydrogenophaga sp. A37]|uniref:hypothetical protein n=1 Tax=Hydrogenophaga sp. A37 TaxID=1945864 RepID=UPI0015C57AA1|nr:hypothetical protein [Hydrogenophaga sp. A37]